MGIEEAKRATALFQSYVIEAERITLKTRRGTKIEIKQEAHPDSIAANLDMSGYIKHLIKRGIQECQKWDSSKQGSRGKYVTIYGAIRREFGKQWQDMSQARFDAVAEYLQRRIRGTKLGKVKSHNLYSTFHEYLRKYGSDSEA